LPCSDLPQDPHVRSKYPVGVTTSCLRHPRRWQSRRLKALWTPASWTGQVSCCALLTPSEQENYRKKRRGFVRATVQEGSRLSERIEGEPSPALYSRLSPDLTKYPMLAPTSAQVNRGISHRGISQRSLGLFSQVPNYGNAPPCCSTRRMLQDCLHAVSRPVVAAQAHAQSEGFRPAECPSRPVWAARESATPPVSSRGRPCS
jgi:hypothetical protein